MRIYIVSGCVMVLALSLALGGAAFAEPNMQEGMWEMKGDMKLEGMPFPMPAVPFSYSKCMTKKDMVPQQKEKNQECTMVSNKIEGNTVSWVMRCKDKKGAVTESTGSVTYEGVSFSGKIHTVTMVEKGDKSESNMNLSGKRTGDCKKE